MADDPRDELLAVAREIIEKRGYLGLSLRTAAAAAGMTEQVARRYYRDRDVLFAAALRLPVDPASAIPTLVAPGLEGMGERLVRFTLDVLKDPEARDDLMSLARTGAHAGHAAMGIQDFLERGVIDRVAVAIGVPDARMRSALISSYLLGIAMSRYVVRLEPLASASEEEVIRMVAPVIQDLLDPRRPIPGSSRARAAGRDAARDSGAATPAGPAAAPAAAPPPPPPAPPPRPFDPDPGRSSVSSAELIGMSAALSTSALQAAANALRATAAAAAARTPAPASGTATRGTTQSAETRPPTSGATMPTGGATTAASTRPERKSAAPKTATTAKKPAAKLPAANRPTTEKSSVQKAPAQKAPAQKSPAKKSTAKTSTAAKKSPSGYAAGPDAASSRAPAKKPAAEPKKRSPQRAPAPVPTPATPAEEAPPGPADPSVVPPPTD